MPTKPTTCPLCGPGTMPVRVAAIYDKRRKTLGVEFRSKACARCALPVSLYQLARDAVRLADDVARGITCDRWKRLARRVVKGGRR